MRTVEFKVIETDPSEFCIVAQDAVIHTGRHHQLTQICNSDTDCYFCRGLPNQERRRGDKFSGHGIQWYQWMPQTDGVNLRAHEVNLAFLAVHRLTRCWSTILISIFAENTSRKLCTCHSVADQDIRRLRCLTGLYFYLIARLCILCGLWLLILDLTTDTPLFILLLTWSHLKHLDGWLKLLTRLLFLHRETRLCVLCGLWLLILDLTTDTSLFILLLTWSHLKHLDGWPKLLTRLLFLHTLRTWLTFAPWSRTWLLAHYYLFYCSLGRT